MSSSLELGKNNLPFFGRNRYLWLRIYGRIRTVVNFDFISFLIVDRFGFLNKLDFLIFDYLVSLWKKDLA